MARQIWKFFCSVKLTIVLFVLILIPSIIGTIILQNAPSPDQYLEIYGPTWDRIFRFLGFYDVYHDMRFVVLLVLLGLNTLACTINRFKLRWNRAGGMMTHFGMLFILIGALIGSIFGLKGFMVIGEGETTNQISVGRATQRTENLPFQIKLVDFILDTKEEPANKLLVMNVNSGRQESYTVSEGKAIELPRSRWANLLAMTGLKTKAGDVVVVEQFLPHASTTTSITEGPEKTGMAAMEFKLSTEGFQRQAYVVSQLERPYTFGKADLSIGYLALPGEADIDERITYILSRSDASDHIEITFAEQVGTKTYPAEVGSKYDVEDTGYSLEILRYIPDFVITPEREAVSRSDQPNNPAMQVRLIGPDGATQEHWLFAKFPTTHMGAQAPFEMKFTMDPHANDFARALFVLNPADGEPVLTLLDEGKVLEKRQIAPGESYNIPGSPYTFTVERFLENTNVVRKIENRADMPHQPALKVSVKGSSEPLYLWEGTPADIPGYKMVFRQEDLIRDFFSILQVINSGQVVAEKKIEVNDPLRYGGYTFYQASYDSQNLRWSGLQVKRDPGVLFVYAGFTIMTLGMIVIFYINPLLRKSNAKASTPARPNGRQ